MANIREYENKATLGADPFEATARSLEYYGRINATSIEKGAAGLTNAASAIEQHEGRLETAALHAKRSDFMLGAMAQWDGINQKNNDPATHDPNAATNFMATINDRYDEAVGADSLSTPQAKNEHQSLRAETLLSLGRVVHADQANADAKVFHANIEQTANNSVNMAANDPTLLSVAIRQIDALNPAHGDTENSEVFRMKKAAANAAMKGTLAQFSNSPRTTVEQIDHQLEIWQKDPLIQKYADVSDRVDEATRLRSEIPGRLERQEQQDKVRQRQANIEAVDGAFGRLQSRVKVDPDTGKTTYPPDFYSSISRMMLMPDANIPMLDAARSSAAREIKEQLVEAKRATKEPTPDDPAVVGDLRTRVLLPGDDPRHLTTSEIYQAYTNGFISTKTRNDILGEQTKLSTDPQLKADRAEFARSVDSFKKLFTGANLLGLQDPAGEAKFNIFRDAAMKRFDEAHQNQNGAWRQLMSPASKDYIGGMATQYLPGKGKTFDWNEPGAVAAPVTPKFTPETVEKGFAALPRGAHFIGPDGVERIKP